MLACLVIAATALIHLPLSWAGSAIAGNIPDLRPSFTGTLWNGRVNNLPRLGSAAITISPLKLLSGNAGAQFSVDAPALKITGSTGLKGLITANIVGQAFGIANIDPRFAGLQGSYNLRINDMLIRETCQSGGGTAQTNILQKNAAVMRWIGPALSGPVSCQEGDILISLSGEDSQQSVNANIRLQLSGGYRAVIDVSTRDERAGSVLPLFGFEKTGTGYRLSEAGRWM